MFRIPKRYHCPHCNELVVQWPNPSGLNFCTNCRRLFSTRIDDVSSQVPSWAVGVLAVLAINIQFYT
ncbi:MAG: hypothetical protein JW719_06200 [Pirellulales bacterium]|nr:hypothetical protein [Pirellulales bacterium]